MRSAKPFFWTLTAILFLQLLVFSQVHAGPIPDTGQTKCYDAAGNEITCPSPGQAFYGQDGSYTINPPSYTKLDASGSALTDDATSWVMVRDNVTGLIWEAKQNKDGDPNYSDPHDADNYYTWYDSNPATNGGDAGTPGDRTDTEDFINALNAANFGGFSDWRLPTRKELLSIVDNGRFNPAIDSAYFPNNLVSDYWSSTTSASSTGGAWSMYFGSPLNGSGVHNYGKSYSGHVRAVRGGQSGSLGNFVINGDGTVTDKSTGLMWQQATAPGAYTWKPALSHCEGLTLGGYSDWRLPTVKELDSIVDLTRYNPSIDTTYFPDTVASNYWSSTTHAYNSSVYGAWSMDFVYGGDYGSPKSNFNYVRGVRGGQARSLGHLVISAPVQGSSWVVGSTMLISWDTTDLTGDVKISLSMQGGKEGTFETIAENIENNGNYSWKVTGPISVNCMLRIEPLVDTTKWNTQGLFTIASQSCMGNINEDEAIDLRDAILALMMMVRPENALHVSRKADVNGDAKVSITEVIYILQVIAGVR